VQKNAEKLQNLLLIGYSPAQVALPYQLLTIVLNLSVLVLSLLLLVWLRGSYLDYLWQMFPSLGEGSSIRPMLVGCSLFLFVSILNIVAVRRKIMSLL
jgi:hypothetical protein